MLKEKLVFGVDVVPKGEVCGLSKRNSHMSFSFNQKTDMH